RQFQLRDSARRLVVRHLGALAGRGDFVVAPLMHVRTSSITIVVALLCAAGLGSVGCDKPKPTDNPSTTSGDPQPADDSGGDEGGEGEAGEEGGEDSGGEVSW